MKINPCENFSAIIIIITISFFKADFYITVYNYKKPIKVNKSQLK